MHLPSVRTSAGGTCLRPAASGAP